MDTVLAGNKPRIGFVGVGWIGKNRLEAVAKENTAEIAAISDPNPAFVEGALGVTPNADVIGSLDEMASADLEGIVIATPSALHAAQSIEALNKGKAVFCQKPLGRTAKEVNDVVQAAQKQDVLLSVDFSYRFTNGIKALKQVLDSGELGTIYGANLVFHNAYGPDKPWYFDPKLAGGGCVMDLGIHLVDLLVWLLDNPEVNEVSSQLFSKAKLLQDINEQVEDYAVAQLLINSSIAVQMACSWNLPAGVDAVIEVSFYGTNGGVAFKNINGSFYDFTTERFYGTSRQTISTPGDSWGGKAAVNWVEELSQNGNKFNSDAFQYVKSAEILDRIYKRG
ncbi:gfo/Idh/MocA family oxidoreductase [Mucilaginibacter terrenus]|uniref:Gfo/Idh/MocA family oxidoreductase n=1 Tax=Mucilaginibacter terrenus TaxID=2482727 RepID=A0A3E2NP61_9SPHI|nr:Gfo/Idh/MocA family oxidoreductase [Mucilaginibacter terrenus]RFZ82774.1 gfo/Idh/MocA family oxidoreductase [Mucilaginibacter terrenus]